MPSLRRAQEALSRPSPPTRRFWSQTELERKRSLPSPPRSSSAPPLWSRASSPPSAESVSAPGARAVDQHVLAFLAAGEAVGPFAAGEHDDGGDREVFRLQGVVAAEARHLDRVERCGQRADDLAAARRVAAGGGRRPRCRTAAEPDPRVKVTAPGRVGRRHRVGGFAAEQVELRVGRGARGHQPDRDLRGVALDDRAAGRLAVGGPDAAPSQRSPSAPPWKESGAAFAEDHVPSPAPVEGLRGRGADDEVREGRADHRLEVGPFEFVDAAAEGRDAVVPLAFAEVEVDPAFAPDRRHPG